MPLREAGANVTSDMRPAMIACGFVDVTTQCGLKSGYGIQAGDVLLNYSAHTCISIGGGKVANCRTSEGNHQAGDQSGNEIRIQPYWNFPWNCVLRYRGKNIQTDSAENSQKPSEKDQTEHKWTPGLLRMSGIYNSDCVVLQALLNAHHFACGSADGFYGPKTQAAVHKAQAYYGLTVDGICGKATWSKLLETGGS